MEIRAAPRAIYLGHRRSSGLTLMGDAEVATMSATTSADDGKRCWRKHPARRVMQRLRERSRSAL